MMKMIAVGVLLLICTVVSAFPAVNYTGQACSSAMMQVSQRCGTNKTSLSFSNNMSDASNGTHILVFVGEPFELTCCAPPKTNSTGDINATLVQREIFYLLHSGRPLSVLKGSQLNRNLTSNNVTSNNSMCEYSTLSIPKATYSEAGTWMCGAYDVDIPRAELRVIIGDAGRLSCDYDDDDYSWVSINCTLDGYSPAGAKLEWRLGMDSFNRVPVTSNGIYVNGSVSVTGLQLPVEQLAFPCVTINNTYDAAAGGNYSMAACRYKTWTGFNVTRLIFGSGYMNISVGLSAQVGWRQSAVYSTVISLEYPPPRRNSAAGSFHRNGGCLWLPLATILFLTMASIYQH